MVRLVLKLTYKINLIQKGREKKATVLLTHISIHCNLSLLPVAECCSLSAPTQANLAI